MFILDDDQHFGLMNFLFFFLNLKAHIGFRLYRYSKQEEAKGKVMIRSCVLMGYSTLTSTSRLAQFYSSFYF